MDAKPQSELSVRQYWWVFAVSVLAPFAGLWLQTAFSFWQDVPLRTLLRHLDRPGLWVVLAFEWFFTMSTLLLFRRFLQKVVIRWAVFLAFLSLWTYLACVIGRPVPVR